MDRLPTTQALIDRDLATLGAALREGRGATDARVRVLTLAKVLYPDGSLRPRAPGVAAALYEYAVASRTGWGRAHRAHLADVEAIIDQIAALYPPKEAP